jgi:hypothetical protein
MKIYPEFELKKTEQGNYVYYDFKSHVRVKYKKQWWNCLVAKQIGYRLSEEVTLERIIEHTNVFLNECLKNESCLIINKQTIELFNRNNPDALTKSNIDISTRKLVQFYHMTKFKSPIWRI